MSVLSPDKDCADVEDIVFLYRYAHAALFYLIPCNSQLLQDTVRYSLFTFHLILQTWNKLFLTMALKIFFFQSCN